MNDYDCIIIGAGAGGAALASELTKNGIVPLIIERGPRPREDGNCVPYIDKVTSIEGVTIMRAIAAGGTTLISAGCSVRALETEMASLGIDLESEYRHLEKDCNVSPLPESLLSNRSKTIRDAALRAGVTFVPMPKAVDCSLCDMCGNCMAGCTRHARWSAIEYLDEALVRGAKVLYETSAVELVIEGDTVSGVIVEHASERAIYHSSIIVLAAGALETPVLLQKAGIESGYHLSVDLLNHVYGLVPGKIFENELTMPMIASQFHKSGGFILSPNVNARIVSSFIEEKGLTEKFSVGNALGIMIKIADERSGRVFPDGSVSKDITPADLKIFDKATSVVQHILLEAGADPDTIFSSHINGAHPAGTAAIGEVVDTSLETSVSGLFVCDASVLPQAPGLPTIEVIVALAKRLGNHIFEITKGKSF